MEFSVALERNRRANRPPVMGGSVMTADPSCKTMRENGAPSSSRRPSRRRDALEGRGGGAHPGRRDAIRGQIVRAGR